MMLPEGHGLYPGHRHLGGYVRFFNLSTGVVARVHLPLFDDHIVLDSVDGLLLLLHRDHGTATRLLHPFTGDVAELPPLLSLLLPQMEPEASEEDSRLRELRVFLRGVCAAVSISAAGAITVMLALDTRRRVAHATAGDQRWTLSAWDLPFLLTPTVYFQGKLYAVSMRSAYKNTLCIRQIDPPQPNSEGSHSLSLQPPRMIVECPLVGTIGTLHLVECGLELMLVGFNDTSTAHLVVYRLADLISGRIVPTTNIGDHALFLGEQSMCVSANKGLLSVLGDSITCKQRSTIHNPQVGTRDLLRGERYHVQVGSGTWSAAIDGDIALRDLSPYMLGHHIYTCCYRSYWNKGLMVCGAIRLDWSVKPNLWRGVISM